MDPWDREPKARGLFDDTRAREMKRKVEFLKT